MRWSSSRGAAYYRGLLSTALAVLLAASSIFRLSLPRRIRVGAFLERGIPALRAMQSGHPGDYVLWITLGLSTFAAAALRILRS
jgi:hypothetical protein